MKRTVVFYEEEIDTLVTFDPVMVERWISSVESIHRLRLSKLVVGLDTEWRKQQDSTARCGFVYKVAILQICVGHKCLIYQLVHAKHVPQALLEFLKNPNYTFVGVGIDEDASKLTEEYGFELSNLVDLRELAVKRTENRDHLRAGLKRLGVELLGKELEKPKKITLSRWDAKILSYQQLEYACLDAFVSFELGRVLQASVNNPSSG